MSTTPDPLSFLDLEGFANPTSGEPRFFHSGDEFTGQPYVLIDDEGVNLVGDRKNLISVDPGNGVLLAGDVSLSTMPDHLAFAGGYFRLNPLVLSTLPSTTPTPIPMLIKSTPKLLQGLSGQSSILGSLQSSLGI